MEISGRAEITSFELTLKTPDEVAARVGEAVRHLGCEDCGTLSLTGVHLCEHGVTAMSPVTVEMSIAIDDQAVYEALRRGG